MVKAVQVEHLIKAHMDRDEDKFRLLVRQIASKETKKISEDLIGAMDSASKGLPQMDLGLLSSEGLEYWEEKELTLADLIVSEKVRESLDAIVLEHDKKEVLVSQGLSNIRKILLVGGSGTGKTMTASVLATELGLVFGKTQLDRIIDSHMGVTTQRLKRIFDRIGQHKAVYLFDEIDSLVEQRGAVGKVEGEMRRIVNSFLQYLDDDCSESIIIGTTNDFDVIDKAIIRRFDEVIYYDLPDGEQIGRLLGIHLPVELGVEDKEIIVSAMGGLSHANIELISKKVHKESVLHGREITRDRLCELAVERRGLMGNEKNKKGKVV